MEQTCNVCYKNLNLENSVKTICNHFFCSIHGLYEQHKCKIYTEKLNNYVECPLCNIKFTLYYIFNSI